GVERDIQFVLCGCGGRCEPIVAETTLDPAKFGNELLASFRYPLRGEGRLQLLLGAAVFGILIGIFGASITSALPDISVHPEGSGAAAVGGAVKSGIGFATALGAGLALLAIAGYVFAYMELVIVQTSNGHDEAPGFPEFLTIWESMVQPIGRLALLVLISFGPGLLLLALLPGILKLVAGCVVFAGLVYFPMGLLSVAVLESEQGYEPRRILAAIRIVPQPYALAASLFIATVGLLFGGSFFLADLPFVGGFLRGAMVTYFSTVAAS